MTTSRRVTTPLAAAAALALLAALTFTLIASPSDAHRGKRKGHAAAFPAVIPLPNGWQPEGIASGRGKSLFVGSIPTGAIYKIDARTGQGAVFVQGRTGRAATGLKVGKRNLFVSGARTGKAFIYDAKSGADVAELTLTTDPSFINDVTLTRNAAYFTDSVNPRLYRVTRDNGTYVSTPVPITGDLQYDADPNTFEVNGIAATRNGKALIAVQSGAGKLFQIDPATGASKAIPLTGGDGNVANGDGLLLVGRTLYVVQNRLNKIAVIKLARDLSGGTITGYLTNAAFDVPTTIAAQAGALYAVNARFGTTPTPETTYSVVRVEAGGKRGGHHHGGHHRRGRGHR